ncbi:hypothetical protein N7462_010679 [Penicillium macrosclerotiorum]|uniref:uncharacterized protein n=1 Tax=Penicillium macrosclerotiorum TaxID=303699 RepID=UPI00254948F4|nr:uncharacterized protein N7462_010679 [Penicillium macrosclerotiorum]KAJ5669609.1 hypothetical protein N7462_010679 [Penicillium macrosclerotiorum]
MKFIQERPDEKLSPGHHLFLYMFDEDRPANAFDQAKRSQVRRFAKSRLPLTLHDTIKVRSSEEVHQDTLGVLQTRNTDVFPIQCLSRHHEEWILTQATLEPACLLGLISYSAALLDSEKGPGNQNMIGPRTASYWHVAFKVKAIRYLSEKVSNPEDALSITTIYGVACVLAIEMLNGDKEAIATNLQGLKTIVSIRGGFQGIPAAIMDLIIR